MNLKSIVQSMREASHHPLAWLAFFVFIIVVTAVGITWNIAKEIRIENLQDEIKGLERDLDREREASAKKLDPKEVKNFLTFAAERIEDNINETNSSDIQIKARVTEDSEHILTTFSLEPVVPTERYDFLLEEKAYFPSGEYSLKMAYERSKFIKAIFSFIGIVQKYYPEEKADVKALFQGGADSKSNDIGIVSEYKGEFGTIIAEKVIINGKETSVILYPGEGITNAHLAFLRAYGAFDAFRSILKDMGVPVSEFKVQLIANEYKPRGRQYRFGQMTIAIRKDVEPFNPEK